MKVTDLDLSWDADSFLWGIAGRLMAEYKEKGILVGSEEKEIFYSYLAFFGVGKDEALHPETLTEDVMWFWDEVLDRYNKKFEKDLPEKATYF